MQIENVKATRLQYENILERIKELLIKEENNDSSLISLYDVKKIVNERKNEYYYTCDSYEMHFGQIMYGRNYINKYFRVSNFDYQKKMLEIKYCPNVPTTNEYYSGIPIMFKTIIFSKRKDGSLYVVGNETPESSKIMQLVGKYLSELYDRLMEFPDFQESYNIKSSSLNFKVSINPDVVSLYYSEDKNQDDNNIFEISTYDDTVKPKIKCDSEQVMSAIIGKEYDIFKKIYVKIDDCPEWIKQYLYQLRQEQLEKQKQLAKDVKPKK